VIVIDDGSTDGTGTVAREFPAPFSKTVLHQEHAGQCKGRNLGIRNARGRIVLFVDSDMFVARNIITEHLETHRVKGPRIIVQGPAINTDNLEKPEAPSKGFHFYVKIQWGYFITWNASIEKDLLFEAGLFDETFRMWDDVELGLRLRKLGVRQIWNGNAIGYHYKPPFQTLDIERWKKKFALMGWDAYRYTWKHPRLDTRIASGYWFGNLLWHQIRKFFFAPVLSNGGSNAMLQTLEGLPWKLPLAFLINLIGKNAYMEGLLLAVHKMDPKQPSDLPQLT
jgi:glycosyltransferase involved in cell wall biosynthesis